MKRIVDGRWECREIVVEFDRETDPVTSILNTSIESTPSSNPFSLFHLSSTKYVHRNLGRAERQTLPRFSDDSGFASGSKQSDWMDIF